MRQLILVLLSLALLSGCGLVYRSSVYQGNLLEESAVAELQAGLTKRQVVLLLGTPSVQDPFHQSRWDYVATVKRGRGDTEVKNLTLHFQGELLERWEGNYFPEQDLALTQELGRYGNLPRDKDKDKRRSR